MTKHENAVGSWHVDGHNMASVIRKTADGWETVARCPNENASWREDARKIAAAPDLLEALQLLAADVKDYPAWQRPCHALDKALAAIAKATATAA